MYKIWEVKKSMQIFPPKSLTPQCVLADFTIFSILIFVSVHTDKNLIRSTRECNFGNVELKEENNKHADINILRRTISYRKKYVFISCRKLMKNKAQKIRFLF